VKEICNFYVSKCTGKYEDNKAAARYIHNMAEEIMGQLAGVANEIQRSKGQPELYQALLDEWNDNFPPSLGAIGTPKNISLLVANQTKEIDLLRNELGIQVSKRENDVAEILRSMDAQLQAYKVSIMNERRHQKIIDKETSEENEMRIKSLEKSHSAEVDALTKEHLKQTKAQSKAHDLRILEVQQIIQHQQDQIKAITEAHSVELDKVKQSKDRKYLKLLDKYDQLKAAYKDLLSLLNDDESEHSLPSVLRDQTDDDMDESIGLHEDADVVDLALKNYQRSRQERIEKEKASKLNAKRNKSVGKSKSTEGIDVASRDREDADTSSRSNPTDPHKGIYRQLKLQIDQLSTALKASQGTINSLNYDLKVVISDNSLYANRIVECEKINESLRRALSARLQENGLVVPESYHTLEPTGKILCHTPHFLRTDKSGPLGNEVDLSAYLNAGIF